MLSSTTSRAPGEYWPPLPVRSPSGESVSRTVGRLSRFWHRGVQLCGTVLLGNPSSWLTSVPGKSCVGLGRRGVRDVCELGPQFQQGGNVVVAAVLEQMRRGNNRDSLHDAHRATNRGGNCADPDVMFLAV